MIQIQLPWPPTLNSYWTPMRCGAFAKMRVSPDGKLYHDQVLNTVRAVLGPVGPKMSTRLRVELELRPPDRRVRDLDNYCKALLDSLTKADVWVDDSQIDELIVRRGQQAARGCVNVLISEIEPLP